MEELQMDRNSSMTSASISGGKMLQFAPFQSSVDEGFWRTLSSLKLDKLRIDESSIQIRGFYAPCSHTQVSNKLRLIAESLPTDPSENSSKHEITHGNRNKCPIPGILYNTNTVEGFHALDKKNLLKTEANKIWEDICSGKAEKDGAVLLRFLIISFADLKKWRFRYWFAFPALVLDPPATLINLQPASQYFTLAEGESLSAACNEWRNSLLTTDIPFFLVTVSSNSCATLRPLKDWEVCRASGEKVCWCTCNNV